MFWLYLCVCIGRQAEICQIYTLYKLCVCSNKTLFTKVVMDDRPYFLHPFGALWHPIFFFIVVQGQLSPFSHHHFPQLHPLPPPTLNPSPLWLCPWVLYTCSLMTLPLPSLLSPCLSPLVTASLFFIPMSLIIFCLLVCFVD